MYKVQAKEHACIAQKVEQSKRNNTVLSCKASQIRLGAGSLIIVKTNHNYDDNIEDFELRNSKSSKNGIQITQSSNAI